MSLLVTQRPNGNGVWVTAKNPVIYKMTREDFTWTTLVNSGGNTSIQIATDVTASFVTGDTIWLQSDDGAYSASGTVVSSAFGAATTVITTVPYVANNASGYINITSRRPNYYVGVGVYRATLNTLIGTVNYYPNTIGNLTIDVSSVLLSVLDPSLPNGTIVEGIINDSTAYQGFYIKYTEFWTGSGNSATDDVANISYGVIGAKQIGEDAYLASYAESSNEIMLSKFSTVQAMTGGYYCFSFIDTQANTDLFVKKTWLNKDGITKFINYVRNYNTASKAVYTYSQYISEFSSWNLGSSANSFADRLYPYLNNGAGTSWTFNSVSTNPSLFLVNLGGGTASKYALAACYIPSGTVSEIYYFMNVSGGSWQLTLGWFDINGTNISSSVITSAGGGGIYSGTKSFTPGSNVYYIGLLFQATSGSATGSAMTFSLLIPNNINTANLTVVNATSYPLTETNTIVSTTQLNINQTVCNLITLFWRNNLAGESSWSFGYSQDQVQRLQDPFKNNWLTLYDQNLTLTQFNSLNELLSINQVYQTPIIELTTSIDKTEARVGQQVYAVDSSGNKKGVIVIGGENKTRTHNKKHSFQVTIELPEIFG